MGETIIAIIAALGGTAGIVSIINAFKNKGRSDQEEIELFKKAFEDSGLKEEITSIKEKLSEQDESTVCLLRHEITSIYYENLAEKKLSIYTK